MRSLVARVRDAMGDANPRSDLALVAGMVLAGVMVMVVVVAVGVAVVQLVS